MSALREQIAATLADPNVAFVVLLTGILCIYVEFCWPGSVLPGSAGGVLAMVALYALWASKWKAEGVALLLLAAALFLASAFVSTRGLLGIAGAAALIAGAILWIDAPPERRIRPVTAIAVSIPFALITILLTETAVRARTNKQAEQFRPVVFDARKDILSTMSDDSGQRSAQEPRPDGAG